MQVQRLVWSVVLAAVSPVFGQWESGSDGSDGAFSPAITTVVDLSLAASLCDCDADTQVDDVCRWDCPSPVAGRGVYDAEQWAVVFKYTTVNVPSGATITFSHHPSGAPVAWLTTGSATIAGTVNLSGEDGTFPNPGLIPYYTRPGPGGYQGGQPTHTGAPAVYSRGFGPGSSPTNDFSTFGGGASYATLPLRCYGGSSGALYGSPDIIPLLGGSGGNQGANTSVGCGGGAGGGAIFLASDSQITLSSGATITAMGGAHGGLNAGNVDYGGAGSGGAVRLRSATVSLAAGSVLEARGGLRNTSCGDADPGRGGNGRVRIESNTITNNGSINGSSSLMNSPSVVFPATPAQLYVTSACGQSAPADPVWGIMSTDIDLNSGSACTVNIQGTGMPVGTIVVVRLIPARGNIVSVNSTPMADAGGGLRTATASVTFPGGRSEIQLRGNW